MVVGHVVAAGMATMDAENAVRRRDGVEEPAGEGARDSNMTSPRLAYRSRS